ncbi:MAG: arsenite efflux transporter metallochaperone ArsD [Acidobacteria bacterium]|nr:arsenite efflux transporter metallochaperone ArsD [Acidobacteriota bacterium]
MSRIQVFDPALCCNTGVCGTEVDQALVTFAADVEWARQHGAAVDRYNLAQDPTAFATNAAVLTLLERTGAKVLPVVLVDGEVAMAGRYPDRTELAQWAGLKPPRLIPMAGSGCAGPDCC